MGTKLRTTVEQLLLGQRDTLVLLDRANGSICGHHSVCRLGTLGMSGLELLAFLRGAIHGLSGFRNELLIAAASASGSCGDLGRLYNLFDLIRRRIEADALQMHRRNEFRIEEEFTLVVAALALTEMFDEFRLALRGVWHELVPFGLRDKRANFEFG